MFHSPGLVSAWRSLREASGSRWEWLHMETTPGWLPGRLHQRQPVPPPTDPTSQLWAEGGAWVFLLALHLQGGLPDAHAGCIQAGLWGRGAQGAGIRPWHPGASRRGHCDSKPISRPGRLAPLPSAMSCERPGAPAEPSAGRPPRRLQMVVASGVACSLGRQVTTVTVRREARVSAGDNRPQRQPWNLHNGGMAAGVSPWSDQDRATSVWQRTSKKGKQAYGETGVRVGQKAALAEGDASVFW